jgi:hypothetical protein
VSRFGVGPSAVPGDLFVDGEKVVVGGFVYDSAFHPRTAVARVLAGASTTGGTGGDTTATPARARRSRRSRRRATRRSSRSAASSSP